MSCPLGFKQQGGIFTGEEWACGAFSFGHMLNLLGICNTFDENKNRLQTIGGLYELPIGRIILGLPNLWSEDGGTEIKNIRKQIRKIGSEIIIKESHEKRAKKNLDDKLKHQIPFIVSVDDGRHWMVVCGKYDDKYIIIDSGDKSTISYYSWSKLRNRWSCECENCHDEDEEESSGVIWCETCEGDGWCPFCDGEGEMDGRQCRSCLGSGQCIQCNGEGWLDYCERCNGTGLEFYGVGINLPNNSKIGTKAALKQIKYFIDDIKEDVGLQEFWGFYLKDLNEIFELNLKGSDVVSAAELFDDYGDQIVDMVDRWIGECNYDIEYELDNYRFVAEFYDFKFHKKNVEEVLIDFTTMFTLAMADDEWDSDC